MDNFTFDDSYKALFFGMAVYIVCLIIRRGLELALPVLKGVTRVAKIWELFILPVMPVLLGGLAGGFIKTFPYPDGLTSVSTHVMYGLVCGFAAGWTYRILKAVAEKKWDVKLPGDPDDKIGALLIQLPPDQLLKAHQEMGKLLLKTASTEVPADPPNG